MKNSEEDILKRFLQDTFSDYEPEPSDLTWENIRKEIQPQQPQIGEGLKRWIVPVVALLLLIGGIIFNNQYTENKPELAMNSGVENAKNDLQIADYQKINAEKLINKSIDNTNEKSEKIYVNTATSKVESKVLPKVEKSLEVPTFSTIATDPNVKSKVQEYSVSTKEFIGINHEMPVVSSLSNSLDKNVVVSIPSNNRLRKIVSLGNPVNPDNNVKDNVVRKNNPIKVQNPANITDKIAKSSYIIGVKSSVEIPANFANESINHNSVNDAIIQEVRYIKPLEMLKNKDFALVKNQLTLPQISQININQEAKPVRRPVYVSVGITPLQTYRILTVNNKNIQNLQTNNLFDSERNGWAFELGITKPIGNKWNLRSSISYLKMRQWAEYQINTGNISVKNSNNYSNAVTVGNTDNEFIGQTRIEAKTLQMVGLKADVQRFFKITGRNRYFISGGSQLMVEPSEKQTNVFINASAGFQHLVNKDCFLTIEPTASYLLNNINDSRSLIQTNAYNLGLKVGLSFRVK